MVPDQIGEAIPLRRADNGERFVAFAFAAADLVVEVDTTGVITFAAGAFRSRFGRVPEEWVGTHMRELVSRADHEALETALLMLRERGRLLPLTVRLSNPARSKMALAGMRRSPSGQPDRFCLTLALLPAPLGRVMQASSTHSFARAAEARMRVGSLADLALLEITGPAGEVVGSTIEALAPDAVASEIAPGRYGLLGAGKQDLSLADIAGPLEAALRDQGLVATVASRNISIADEGLSTSQAARALRQALDAFARSGISGLDVAGFSSGLASYVRGAMQHTGLMRRAISQRKFALMFQPIVQFSGRTLHHYEALLRPQPIPDLPAATPQEFVILAETIGLAVDLDLAVVNLACEAALRSSVPVAFNVSAQSMQDPGFRDKLRARVAGQPPPNGGRLVVEMTETAQVEDIAEAAKTAQLLRDWGIPFCLDDFGAGSADMRVLRGMPADIVKLDGSYVSGVVGEGRERAFVAGMIEIARAAKAEVVAEWVETEEEAVALAGMGARYGQGWLFGEAAPLP